MHEPVFNPRAQLQSSVVYCIVAFTPLLELDCAARCGWRSSKGRTSASASAISSDKLNTRRASRRWFSQTLTISFVHSGAHRDCRHRRHDASHRGAAMSPLHSGNRSQQPRPDGDETRACRSATGARPSCPPPWLTDRGMSCPQIIAGLAGSPFRINASRSCSMVT